MKPYSMNETKLNIPQLTNRTYALILVVIGLITYLMLTVVFPKETEIDRDTIWQLVPNESIALIEVKELNAAKDSLLTSSAWQDVSYLPYLSNLEDLAEWFDSLQVHFPAVEAISEGPLWLSMHATAKKEVGFMVYIPTPKPKTWLKHIMEYTDSIARYSYVVHQYRDWEVKEIKDVYTGEHFSFILHDDYLIGSFTPWLVEDVVRHYDAGFFATRDWKQVKDNFNRKSLPNRAITFYWNHSQLPNFANVFSHHQFKNAHNWLQDFSDATAWSIWPEANAIMLQGNTLFELYNNDRLAHLFEEQEATRSDLAPLIPLKTAYLFRFGFDQPETFFKSLYDFQKVDEGFMEDIWENYHVQIKELWKEVDGELALATIGPDEMTDEKEQLLFIKVKDTAKVANQIRMLLAANPSFSASPSLKQSSYHFMGQFPLQDFPNYAFGDLYEGFENSYFVLLQDYLVIANKISTLHLLLESISKKNVWANRPDFEQVAPMFLAKSHVGFAVNLPLCWKLLEAPMNSTWQQALTDHRRYLTRVRKAYLTFNMQDGQTSGRISLRASSNENEEERGAFKSKLPVASKTKPTWVRNHIDQSNELVFQDRWNRLNLISNGGKRLWSYGITKPISTPIYQIDMYANGKLQYLFGAGNQLHLVDRLGRSVSGFPISTPNDMRLLNVLDVDKNRQYFFAMSDPFGQVYMYNKYKHLRYGWQPRRLNGEAIGGIKHIKVGNEDYIVAVQKDGVIYVMDKFGRNIEGFPLGVHEESLDFMLIKGADLQQSALQLLTAKGLVIRVDFTGKVRERIILPKEQSFARFSLCKDEKGSADYLFAKQEGREVTIMDTDGKLLFKQTFPTKHPKDIQFFRFSLEVKLVAITDKISGKTHLYFTSGDPLYGSPYESEQPVSIHYDKRNQAYYLSKFYGKRVEAIKLGVR